MRGLLHPFSCKLLHTLACSLSLTTTALLPSNLTQQGEFIDASLLENHYMCSENYKMLRSRMKALLGKEKSQRNPMLAGRRSSLLASNGVDTDKNSISIQDNESLAMQLDVDADHKANLKDIKPMPKLLLACISAGREVFKKPRLQDFLDSLFKRRILLERGFRALGNRFELILGSMVLHIILALLFAWINHTISPGSVLAYFGIAAMFLIMANVQIIFFVYNNHHVSIRYSVLHLSSCKRFLPVRKICQTCCFTTLLTHVHLTHHHHFSQVFLKEHARGLYSAYTNYTVFSVPLYLLKTVNATLFAVISWAIMDVDSSTGEYSV